MGVSQRLKAIHWQSSELGAQQVINLKSEAFVIVVNDTLDVGAVSLPLEGFQINIWNIRVSKLCKHVVIKPNT